LTIAEFVNSVGFRVNKQDVQAVNSTINSIANTAKKLLGALGIGFSLKYLNSLAEEFDGIGDRIAYAAGEGANLEEIQKKILQSANNSRATYASMANSVIALKQANEKIFPLDEAATFVEYVNKLGATAGYSDSEISAMHATIKRVAASGKASANDVTRMISQTPALSKVLGESLGKTNEQLIAMGKSGQLTAETIKKAVIGSAESIDKAYGELSFGVSDALRYIRNSFGFWVDETNKMFGITDMVGRNMAKLFDKLLSLLSKARTGVQWLNDKVGGTENLIKSLLIVIGPFLLAWKFPAILSGLEKIWKFIKVISNVLHPLYITLIAIALIVEDFIGFMQGKDSVIGYAFEKAGIDAETMRDKIIHIWGNLKKFFAGVWDSLKKIAEPVINWLKKKLGDDLFENLGEGFAGVIEFIDRLTGKLSEDKGEQSFIAWIIAFGALAKFFSPILSFFKIGSGLLKLLRTDVAETVDKGKEAGGLVKKAPALLSLLGNKVFWIAAAIAAVVAIGVVVYKNWDTIKEKGKAAFEAIHKAIEPVVEILQFLGGIIEGVISGIGKVVNWVKGFSWSADGKIQAPQLNVSAADGYERNGVEHYGGGRSETNYKDKANALLYGYNEAAGQIRTSQYAKKSTAVSSTRNTTNNKTVNQKVEIHNTFNGDKAGQEKSASAMNKAASDASDQLARSLAYCQ